MDVLVTGGAGRIGSRLVAALLNRGDDVIVLDDFSTGTRERVPDGADVVQADVTAPEWVSGVQGAGIDVIYHLAARVDVQASVKRPVETHETNVTGTLRVLEAARRIGARVVLASSAAVYGSPNRLPITERHRREPTSPYGQSKAAAEGYTRLYADTYGVEGVILRYFNVYGPGQTGVVDTFIDRARAGEDLEIHGDGMQTRDFIHVDDVVDATIRAADRGRPGAAYNIGVGSQTRICDLAQLVTELADQPVSMTHTTRPPGDLDESEADTTRARVELGFDPERSLAEYVETRLTDAGADGVYKTGGRSEE